MRVKRIPPLSLRLTAGLAAATLAIMVSLTGAWMARPAFATSSQRGGRLVVLMVWDGLRPDAVTEAATPNLYALAHTGVYLADHHAAFPSQTMVNAATLATGAPPSANGITNNEMYLAPLLGAAEQHPDGPLKPALAGPVSLEHSPLLMALSSQDALDGNLVEVRSIAQELLGKGGYVGIVGKAGPTFLFDDQVGKCGHGTRGNELFVSDDWAEPQSLAFELGAKINVGVPKKAMAQDPPFGDQDSFLTQVFIDHALPAAAAALKGQRPALLVLWQHNPDITQHAAGLGTRAFSKAIAICDTNLGKVRAAIEKLGIADRTDVVVVSDHGFATIKARVELADLLVAQGLKESATSTDVIVARNFGTDAVYLSPALKGTQRSARLQSIVNYAGAQKWSGPIFSRPAPTGGGYLGAVAGTFSEAWFGLLNSARSPDLFISFRELEDEDNAQLMGPTSHAFVLGGHGMSTEPNRSQPLVHPMRGVMYADAGSGWSTGMGNHGALGNYQMHNFGAVIGPDFRAGYIDRAPTSNLDLGRTIAMLLDAQPASAPGTPFARGRLIAEALKDGPPPKPHQHREISTTLDLPDRRTITTIDLEEMDGEMYPSGSSTRSLAALEQVRAGEGSVADRQDAPTAALKVADGGG